MARLQQTQRKRVGSVPRLPAEIVAAIAAERRTSSRGRRTYKAVRTPSLLYEVCCHRLFPARLRGMDSSIDESDLGALSRRRTSLEVEREGNRKSRGGSGHENASAGIKQKVRTSEDERKNAPRGTRFMSAYSCRLDVGHEIHHYTEQITGIHISVKGNCARFSRESPSARGGVVIDLNANGYPQAALHCRINNGSAGLDEQPSLERNSEKPCHLELVAYLLLVRPPFCTVVEWLATFNQKRKIEQGKGERSCPLFSGNIMEMYRTANPGMTVRPRPWPRGAVSSTELESIKWPADTTELVEEKETRTPAPKAETEEPPGEREPTENPNRLTAPFILDSLGLGMDMEPIRSANRASEAGKRTAAQRLGLVSEEF
ncbi:hypothetical protein AgCh_037669 [Apium graveolens]